MPYKAHHLLLQLSEVVLDALFNLISNSRPKFWLARCSGSDFCFQFATIVFISEERRRRCKKQPRVMDRHYQDSETFLP